MLKATVYGDPRNVNRHVWSCRMNKNFECPKLGEGGGVHTDKSEEYIVTPGFFQPEHTYTF